MFINFLSLYLFITILVIIYISSYALNKRIFNYAIYFSVLCLCVCFYLLGYLLELNSGNLQQMIFWNQVQYIGLPFYSALWLAVTLLYTKTIRKFTLKTFTLLFFIPILTFLFRLTNPLHNLYYISMQPVTVNGQTFLLLGKGVWYYVHAAFQITTLLINNYILIKANRKYKNKKKNPYKNLIAASFLPYIGVILILTNFLGTGIDYSALITPISVFLVVFAMFVHDFLGIKATVRESIYLRSSTGNIILDANQNIVDFNDSAFRFFSMQGVELSLTQIDDILQNKSCLLDVLKSENSMDFEASGNYYEIMSETIQDKYGKKIGVLKTILDITDKKKAEQRLNELATIDGLSGLFNRRRFMELACETFSASQKNHAAFCLIMMDIDNFKNVNDKYGHSAGDAAINAVGKLIKKQFKETDISGRLGGEEFSVILKNINISKGYEITERFRKSVQNNVIEEEENKISFTVSLGVVQYDDSFKNFDEMLRLSDKAMYESKAKGKNCTTVKLTNSVQGV